MIDTFTVLTKISVMEIFVLWKTNFIHNLCSVTLFGNNTNMRK